MTSVSGGTEPGNSRGRRFGASRLGALILLTAFALAGLSVPAAAAQQTIFGEKAPSGVFTNAERQLGLRFTSDAAGQITAIRFYRVATNGCDTVAHTGYIYELAGGDPLASVAIPASTVTGWQEQALATPVSIAADTTYVVAVDEFGCYGATVDSGLPISNGQNLTGLVGVFSDSASAFPMMESGNNANFFRDIVFEPTETQTGACIKGGKFVSVNGLDGTYIRNSVTADNPDTDAANPKITFVSGANDIPDELVNIPGAIFGGTPVLYQFEITNCGDVDLYNVRVDDCIDVRSVGDDGFLTGGVGAGGEGNCEQPRLIPTFAFPDLGPDGVLTPGETIIVTATNPAFAGLPVNPESSSFTDICEIYGGARADGIVRNDVEFEAEADLNGDGNGTEFVFFDELNLVQCVPPTEKASLGDRVWKDLNANGVQDCLDTNGNGIIGDPGDTGPECSATGIGGVTVELYGPDCNGLITNTTTDQDGFYSFLDLDASQQYCLRFDQASAGTQLGCDADLGGLAASPQNAIANAALDSDANPETGQTANISLTPGAFDRTWDAGFYCLSKLGDQVWNDLNRNGIQNDVPNTEPGIPGVPVALFQCDADGNPPADGEDPIATTVTNSEGLYDFAGLMPGNYYVSFTAPSSFVFSPQNVGADDTVDSDADNNGNTLIAGKCPIELPPNTFDPTWDAGLNQPPTAELGDFVFEDKNADGIQDQGEPGIPDVPVKLYDADCSTFIADTVTGENGLYLFDNLAGGTYCVEFVKDDVACEFGAPSFSPANRGGDDAKDSDADPDDGQTGNIALPEGVSDRTWDAGIYCPAKLGDQVWDDLNQNGLQDNVPNTEPGVSGVTANLLDCDGNPVTDLDGFSSTTTDADGIYTFPVKPGDYIVEFVAPVDKLFTTQNVGVDDAVDSDANPVSGRTACISVPSNVYDDTWDAGLIPPPDCGLAIEKSCAVVVPPTEPFVCDDKVDELQMIWNGPGTLDFVTAYRGDVGEETIQASISTEVIDGEIRQLVTVSGYQPSTNDVQWQWSSDGASGISQFHLSCSDDEMDGETDDPAYPRDCGRPQGNGKDNSSGDNAWLLEGLKTDKAFVLDCTPPETPTTACAHEARFASCETLPSNPDILTFRYTGGGCEATDNFQKPDDVSCEGSVNPTLPVTVVDAGKASYLVQPGGTFDVPRDDADKLTLTNSGGTEALELHTSCSQPLQTGDVYGSLTLSALDGVGLGTDVTYSYLVENQGTGTITDISVVDDKLGEIEGSPIASLPSGESTTLDATAFILETTTNTITASGTGAPGAACTATSETTVTVNKADPCSVSVAFDSIADDKVKYKLTNTGLPVARMETLVLNFDPGYVSIKEVKLDGTVYKLSDSSDPAVKSGDIIGETVPPADAVWTEDDSTKRQLDPGEDRILEIVFTTKQDKEDFTPDDFSGSVIFNDGQCSVGL